MLEKGGAIAHRPANARTTAGQLLREMEKATGARGNPGGQGAPVVPSRDTRAQKLSDLGISHDQSSRWQKLAAIPIGVTKCHETGRDSALSHDPGAQ